MDMSFKFQNLANFYATLSLNPVYFWTYYKVVY
jgi:hypothetical protein